MKRILFITAVLVLAACHMEPYPQDGDSEYLVYTSPDKNINFSQFMTFDIADSVLVIGQSEKPEYSQSDNALALIQAYRTNMENAGYIYTPSNPDAELGIQLTFIIRTERYVQYYSNPNWWLDYPGYWPAGYWGNWTGWYYAYPVTYTYTTNALVTEMVDLTADEGEGKSLPIVWTNYIGGPGSYSMSNDVKRIINGIDQAFAQSPYLGRNTSR